MALVASPVLADQAPILPSLGSADSVETVTASNILPGIKYSRIERWNELIQPVWFVSYGLARDENSTQHFRDCAVAGNLAPVQLGFTWPGSGLMPYSETVAGAFGTRDEAVRFLAAHPQPAHCQSRITASPLYPNLAEGPWRVHVVEIDPKTFEGGFRIAHGGNHSAGRSTTSAISREAGAAVAVNGGYFVMEMQDGIVGESAGLSIASGAMQSEPSWGRPWFVFPNPNRAEARLQTSPDAVVPQVEWGDGTISRLDGIDRNPDQLRNCGSFAAGAAQLAWHDKTCHPTDQLVAITIGSGVDLKQDEAHFVAILHSDGRVDASDPREAKSGDRLLLATGKRRDELVQKLAGNRMARLTVPLLKSMPNASGVAGGPTLLYGGRLIYDELREGWPLDLAGGKDANDMHRFIILRAPRTAIGVRSDGTVLLVVVDGWRYADNRRSAFPLNGGASIEELRRIMLDLGADQAMNLDGGGSTTLVINGTVINQPTDPDGERAVGDAVLLVPVKPGSKF